MLLLNLALLNVLNLQTSKGAKAERNIRREAAMKKVWLWVLLAMFIVPLAGCHLHELGQHRPPHGPPSAARDLHCLIGYRV